MPSSRPSVHPVLGALLTALLMTASVLVGAGLPTLPAAQATGAPHAVDAPALPPKPATDAAVSMDLVSLTPTSLEEGSTLTARVEVTNTSSEPLPALSLELRTLTSRVTDRSALASWQADTTADTSTPSLATSPEVDELAPGESTTLTVTLAADELGYSDAPYYWGTRRISLTAVADEDPLASIRSFMVWRPAGAETTITQSVLLPVAEEDAFASVTDPEAHQQSLESGRLAGTRELAQRDDVDWWLDPALLDPPQLPVDPDPSDDTGDDTNDDGAEGDGAEDATDPEQTGDPDSDSPVARTFEVDAASADLAASLRDGVGDRTVLAMPYAQSDLVSVEQADAQALHRAVDARGAAVWEETGIAPEAAAMGIEGTMADGDSLQALLDAGADAAVVPSSSLRPDLDAAVTPSSVGVYESDDGSELPLLAPDPVLSDEFAHLTADSDTEQTQQRLLAETATIASEYTTAPRHLLISPSSTVELDPVAAGAALDALDEAPWIEQGSTSALLDSVPERSWTTDAQDDSGAPYALGTVGPGEVLPSGPSSDGLWEHRSTVTERDALDPVSLRSLDSTWQQLGVLATAMEDDASLDATRLQVLSGTSLRWSGDPEGLSALADDSRDTAQGLEDRIEVIPASGYNLISDSVGVPVTISNDLDSPITVRPEVTSDRPLVQIGEVEDVTVPAHSQVDAAVPVEAVANGTVTLTTVLTTQDGQQLTEPVDVPLTVNPAWENWTTLVIVIAMGLLVVVGVARARRTGASTRAPAVHGPEDPEELSRSGISTVDTSTAAKAWSARAGTGSGTPAPDPDPDDDRPADDPPDTDDREEQAP